jgi:toxin ParE1/3/4
MDRRELRPPTGTNRDTLVQAISELVKGPDIVGSKAREEIMPGLRTLHVARHGRRGRHFLMYRVATKTTIDIVRILHDAMDLQGHIPAATDESGK